MTHKWEKYEDLDAYVYVADIETHELIYMNKKARVEFGIESEAAYRSKKCYKVLQNSNEPCHMCNNSRLEVNKFAKWETYNPILRQHALVIDTLDEDHGRKYRVEIAFDITKVTEAAQKANKYYWIEKTTHEGIRLAMQGETAEQNIRILLEYVGKVMCAERCYIFEYAGPVLNNTYEWVSTGVLPQIDNLQNIPMENLEGWNRYLRVGKTISIKNIEDIREEDPWIYDTLQMQDVYSVVIGGIYDGNKLLGFYGVDNPSKEMLDDISEMLQILAFFVAATLKRRDLQKKLEKLSYIDNLTGFGNRHALYEYMDKLNTDMSLGIVYCDVTGLKYVNDTQGHTAGDKLILDACACMREVLKGYSLFRIGGDELLAICSNREESIVQENVKALREHLRRQGVNMAVGVCWSDDSAKDVNLLMRKSEENMYVDKSNYYSSKERDRRGSRSV